MRERPTSLTRREFTAGLAASGLWVASCASARWATDGAERRKLRLVFYTDVHARTEWETPLALEQATAAINTVSQASSGLPSRSRKRLQAM